MKTVDLIVIGGGPAGAAAAITAARAGASVTLLEAGRFPRHKVCGEFVSAESLSLLGRLLDASCTDAMRKAPRISAARLFVDGQVVRAEVEPAAASIPRFDLDAALWESAKLLGVEAVERVRVLEVHSGDWFVVKNADREIESRAVIDASGRWSNISQKRLLTQGEAKWIGLKAHFGESSASRSVDLYFFPGGYCGVQPVSENSVNACAMVQADIASSLPEVLELHPALRQRSRDWQMVSDPVSVAPLIFDPPRSVRDSLLLAGDAAGFVDPFVGDGISLALRSGALAAECLAGFLSGKSPLQNALRQYGTTYRQQFGPIFRTSSRLRKMLLLPKAIRIAILAMLQRSPGMTSYLVRKTR